MAEQSKHTSVTRPLQNLIDSQRETARGRKGGEEAGRGKRRDTLSMKELLKAEVQKPKQPQNT